jgi:hypothetical protein
MRARYLGTAVKANVAKLSERRTGKLSGVVQTPPCGILYTVNTAEL